ncbi:MAG: helix-turn-helix domain-containing protein [Alphaproteobacteria bacterium]|nr:helix-turn-helix domain-containing protein [Alphaproteobacteria bacterium]
MPKSKDDVQRIAVAPDDACIMLGIGKTKLFDLLKKQKLHSVKIGRARRITVASILRLLHGEAA